MRSTDVGKSRREVGRCAASFLPRRVFKLSVFWNRFSTFFRKLLKRYHRVTDFGCAETNHLRARCQSSRRKFCRGRITCPDRAARPLRCRPVRNSASRRASRTSSDLHTIVARAYRNSDEFTSSARVFAGFAFRADVVALVDCRRDRCVAGGFAHRPDDALRVNRRTRITGKKISAELPEMCRRSAGRPLVRVFAQGGELDGCSRRGAQPTIRSRQRDQSSSASISSP